MQETRQFRLMVIISIVAHILVIGGVVLLSSFRSQATPPLMLSEALIVELSTIAEFPVAPEFPAQSKHEEPATDVVVAFSQQMPATLSPTPTPTMTPTPKNTFTPRPQPTSTPYPSSTATPVPKPVSQLTTAPRPKLQPTPIPEQTVVALNVPRRLGVLTPTEQDDQLQRIVQGEHTPISSQESSANSPTSTNSRQHAFTFSNRLAQESPLMFETENEFPYPEYLAHIKEKIEGLWFPEGAGIVSIYLIIDKNGKILQSGVDKGTGVGVNNLRGSVVRAMALIQRFQPLPGEYAGPILRVQITVRR